MSMSKFMFFSVFSILIFCTFVHRPHFVSAFAMSQDSGSDCDPLDSVDPVGKAMIVNIP